jgi:hypothetical protein
MAINSNIPPEFNENTSVRVVNAGSKTFKGGHANTTYLIEPGKSRFVPFHAAVRWAGNPWAVNEGQHRETHWRTLEIDRLSTLYGVYSDPWTVEEPWTRMDYSDKRPETDAVYVQRDDAPGSPYYHPNLPNLIVEDSEGNQLPTVLSDPEGDIVSPAEIATRAEQRTLSAQIAELQRQVAQAQLQMAQTQSAIPETTEFDNPDVVSSTPSQSPAPNPESLNPTTKPTNGVPRSSGAGRGPGRPRKA